MKRILVVVGSRANYSSIRSAMQQIVLHPQLELKLVVAASALLDRYGEVVKHIESDGFKVDAKMRMLIEGETPLTMAKSTGLGLLELPQILESLEPDVVLTVGDRFETMATAVASTYMNIRLAHTMGGEATGTIDESIRHAVTKLAHIHFPANQDAADRIIKLGEDPDSVFVTGCPRIDLVSATYKKTDFLTSPHITAEGVGAEIDFNKPYLLVMQHPVTTEYGQGEEQIQETLKAIELLKMQTVMLWPNADAGSEDISRGIRKYRERYADSKTRYYKNFPVDVFIQLMSNCACMIGNSSAAIREGPFMGMPAVNIGSRQQSRVRGSNVTDVDYDHQQIVNAVQDQLAHGKFPSETVYGDGEAGIRIADILTKYEPPLQKKIYY